MASEMTLTLGADLNLELVRIPAGEYWMGSEIWSYDEKPQHRLSLPDYWMGKFPVTVGQYTAFLIASGYGFGPAQIEDLSHRSNYPVTSLTWYDACAFCRWVNETIMAEMGESEGYQARLPTEAEWEKAARGTDGREYPWGNSEPDETRCNFNRNLADVCAVGRYSPLGDSPFGCADMAGNVWEWTHSLKYSYPYRTDDGRESEEGSAERVVRGGAVYSFTRQVRCACRAANDPTHTYTSRGFRMCLSPVRF
jgi:formylglycine-generating enzyme required for sulfatase activity